MRYNKHFEKIILKHIELNNSMEYGNDLRYIENNVILDWIDNRTNFISHYEFKNK